MATREVVSPSAGSEHSLHTMVSPPQPEQVHQQKPSGDSTIVETSSTSKIGDAEAEVTPGEGIVSGDEGERPRTPPEGEGKAQESDGAEGWDVVSAREGTSPPKAKATDVKKDGKGGEKKTVTGGKVAEAIKKFATKATTPGSAAKPAPGKLSARSSLARPTAATLNRSTTAKTSTTPAAGSTTTRPGHKPSPSISSVKNGTPLSSSSATAPRTRPAAAPNMAKPPSTTATSTLARRQSVASSATARATAPSTNGRMTSTSTGTATGKRTPTSSNASSVKPLGALRTTTPPTGAPPRMATKAGSVAAPHRPTATPSVSATATKPPVPKARSSIAPASGKVPATTATRHATGLHGPVKLNTATEGKIRELEEQLEQQKVDFGNRESALQEERKELEERHAAELATIRAELDVSSVQASADSDKRIEELRQAHTAKLDELKEASEVALAELRQALEQTQASLEAALDQCKTLASESQDKDREVAELHAAIASAEAGLNGAQEEVATLKEAHSAGARDVATARAELESLRAELHAKAEEVEQLKRAVQESGTSSSALQDELHALERQVAELKNTKEAAEAAWAKERQSLSMELETHVKATAKGKEQLATIEESARAQQAEIERLHIAQAALTGDHDQARRVAEQHAAKIEELNAKLQQTATEHDKLLMEAAQLSDSKVLDLEDRLSEALKEKAEIMERLRQAEERAEKTEAELKETLETVTAGEQKIGALEEVGPVLRAMTSAAKVKAVDALQKQLAAQQAEHETKYASAYDDAKAAAQQGHTAELAAIRSDLAVTHSQLQAAHAAEIESITAEHATALAAANADHASQLQTLQDQQDASSSALADAQAKLEKATILVKDLTGEVENLEQLVETLKAEAAKVNPSAEADLQRSLREMDGMRDELEGTKLALEMNKSHFQQTLEEMQSQHSNDAAAAAEARAQEAADARKNHEQDMADLQAEMQRLRAELQDEKVAKNTALAQAQARIKTPPPAVISTPPVSPSHLTKLHEAHNAKVAELEGTIKRLSTELAKRPSTVANAAEPGEPSVPAPAPRAATPPVMHAAKDVLLTDLPPLPPSPAHVHGEEDEDVEETF